MRIAHELFTTITVAQSPQAQTAREQAQATREQAQATREQAQQVREQAQQVREQAQEFKENLRAQIQAGIDAAREASEQGIPTPPTPPTLPRLTFGRDDPFNYGPQIPDEAVQIVSILGMTLVFCVVGFPIARAFARWLDRRGAVAAASPDLSNRLRAIEQAVESVAVEVERISEGQRFTTRVLSERTHEPAADFLARDRDVAHMGLPADSGPGAPINARRS